MRGRSYVVSFPKQDVSLTGDLIAVYTGSVPVEIVSLSLGETGTTAIEQLSVSLNILSAGGAQLVCAPLTETEQATVLGWGFADGSFHVTIDGSGFDITGLDFGPATTLFDYANVIQSGIRAIGAGVFPLATCVWNGDQFVIGSALVGSSSSQVSFLSATGSGTDISAGLNGTSATGAVQLTATGITPGTGGSPATPQPDVATDPPAQFTARVLDTQSASTSGVTAVNQPGVFNNLIGYEYIFPRDVRPTCGPFGVASFSLNDPPFATRQMLGSMRVAELF